MTTIEFRYKVHTYDADGEFITTHDTTGGELARDLNRGDEAGGRPVRLLRIREYQRPCQLEDCR